MQAVSQVERIDKRRGFLPALLGLMQFELATCAALHWQLDRQIGFGFRFWGVVVLATGACLLPWLFVRAVIFRHGQFTLKEFLLFVLVCGALLGWGGTRYQQNRQQRLIAMFLMDHGASVFLNDDDGPSWDEWHGKEDFSDVWYVNINVSLLGEADLAVLKQLPKLRAVCLHGGPISEEHLRHVSDVATLAELALQDSEISKSALAHLRGHPNLQRLTIHNVKLEDDALSVLREIPNLRRLRFHNVTLDDAMIADIALSSPLEELCLARMLQDSGLALLANLPHLTLLVLDETQITDAGLAHLSKLKHLRTLMLRRTSVTDAGMEHLAKLEQLTELSLHGTSVSDAGLQHLKPLMRLKALGVGETAVSNAGIDQLKRDMPGLEVVQ